MAVNDVKYLAYATSAVVSNAEKLAAIIRSETGVKVEIITGKKESEIVARNV